MPVILNAAGAMLVGGLVDDFEHGIDDAVRTIDSGAATRQVGRGGRIHPGAGAGGRMSGYLDTLAADLRRDPPEPARGFADALAAGPSVTVIAEIKRASPSQGAIADEIDVAAVASGYTAGGAAALSVLCAERDFAGSLDDLAAARGSSGLPAIAKDFTLFPEQVAAQRLAGADAILIILAMVGDGDAARLLQTAGLLGWMPSSRRTTRPRSSARSHSALASSG